MTDSNTPRITIFGYDYSASQLCLVCNHVASGADVYEVAHDDDDVIQVMCVHHPHLIDDAKPYCAAYVKDLVKGIEAGLILKPGFYATRTDEGWVIQAI